MVAKAAVADNTVATSNSQDNVEDNANDVEEDFFEKAFHLPDIQPSKAKVNRKPKSRPPVVATSEEYKKYFVTLETDKLTAEQERNARKAARIANKKAAVKKQNRPKKR